MARVVSHAMKQASLNLKDMVEKKSIGLEINDIADFSGSFKFWDKDDVKPEIIETTIEQIRAMFNVGTEVKGWRVTYYPPPTSEGKKFTSPNLNIKPVRGVVGGRFVVVVGSREIANLGVSMGKTEADTPLLMLDGDCMYIKITLCPVVEVCFNNVNGEKLAARKGFRETTVRKSPQTRHVFVFDGVVEMGDILDKVKRDFVDTKTTGIDDAVKEVIEASTRK